MESPFIIPLACFVMVVLIVAVVNVAKMRDMELDVHGRLRNEEMEHQRKMKELEIELAKVRQGS
jgi:hypothetical protein